MVSSFGSIKIWLHAGLCGKKDPPHELVPNGQVLFSQAQIDEICKVCTIDPPLHCSQGGVPIGVPAEEVTMSEREQAEEACKSAVPPIAISDAQEKCMSSVDINACITDYCATDGDDTMVEIANEEKNHLVPGSAAIVQCAGCFGNSEGPCKQTNNNVCHAFSVPAKRICPPGTTKCSPSTETTTGGAGASGDGAGGDGASGDGAGGDGASTSNSNSTSTRTNTTTSSTNTSSTSTSDGASGDGASGDGASGDGAGGDGAGGDGAGGAGASGDGASGDGASGDGASGDG